MAMTIEHVLDDIRKLHADRPDLEVDVWADAIDAHLSAQAKAQVTDEDVDRACDAYRKRAMEIYPVAEEAEPVWDGINSALESFADRLSQGAQGEAEENLGRAIQALIRGDIKCSDDLPADKRPQSIGARRGFDAAHKYIRTHPAERAAVPDGWQPTPANINALPAPIRKYIMMLETETDPAGTIRQNVLVREENEMLRAALAEALAAPQPPEGARVVPKVVSTAPQRIYLQVADDSFYNDEAFPADESNVTWCDRASTLACEVEYVRADLVLLATPTLAGKEGAK